VSFGWAIGEPITFVGGFVNSAPRILMRSSSALTSLVKNMIAGRTCRNVACWKALSVCSSFSASCNSVPFGSSSEAAVSQRCGGCSHTPFW